jgi:hypothetical protein
MTTTSTAVVERSVSLYLKAGTSDKEYHLYMCKHTSDSLYSVHAEYGRVPSVSQTHDKTKGARVSRTAAVDIFIKLEREKRGEGYRDKTSLRDPQRIPGGVKAASAATVTVADPRLAACAAALALHRTARLGDANADAMAMLIASAGKSKLATVAENLLSILCDLLGDIACSSQDYLDDAVPVVRHAISRLKRPGTVADFCRALSAEAVQAIEAARAATAPSETREEFLKAILLPLDSARIL